ncbi:DUF222 domain-containing protein [Paeniglutamicibacter sp. NPDC091659]|uniref:HNH endonuclease signature motif containing protein n=1 Tax=Paeniglutamicibacter sp. NPDC091659 TaxID=3364389 RepID=UPI0037F92E0F
MSTQASTSTEVYADPGKLGQAMAAAVLGLRELAARLQGTPLDAAASAVMLGLLEQGHRAIAYAQLVATLDADIAQIHRLDPATAQHVDDLVADPQALADGTVGIPTEIMCQGMAPHRNTVAYAQAHLHISVSEARRRLTGARLLVAPAPVQETASAGAESTMSPENPRPSYPVLAGAAADGTADVGNLSQLAGRLDGMQPRITPRPDARNITTAIEESLVHEARTGEPKSCGKALQDWEGFLADNGSPITDGEILAKRGMFYRGYRDGCDEFLLRCDPIDSEVILAFGEAWSNPRSEKLPPSSASTAATQNPSSVMTDENAVFSPSGTPVYCPVGTPAPAWALAPGVVALDAPLSQLDCGRPPRADPFEGSASDPRSSSQLLLDAVVAACAGVLSSDDVSDTGGMHVKIGVLIGYQSLLGQMEDAGFTAHGRPISAANIRRMACNADLLPAVLATNGELLDLGREARGFNKAQRRALALRDRGCTVPGCHRSAATSEAHHVKPWLEGGETSVKNGALLCLYHHLQVHAGLITMKMIDGVPYLIQRAGQPRGVPERNLHWHPELRTSGYTAPLFTD